MKIVSVLMGLYEKAGGVTRVSMLRAQEFRRRGIDSFIATLSYDNNLLKKDLIEYHLEEHLLIC
jgi:hypothetical protein